MNAAGITFDPANHTYIYHGDGRVIPSVTQVLTGAGLIDNRFYTEAGRDRGTFVHNLCEAFANGEREDEHGIPLDAYEYVDAFAAWMRDRKVYSKQTEGIIFNTVEGISYAGKFDLLAEIEGKLALYDIKTGSSAKWHPAQVAAYAMATRPAYAGILYLKKDGTYIDSRLSAGRLLEGMQEFKSALVTYTAKAGRSME